MNGNRITVGMLAAVILLLVALYPYIYITSRPAPTTVTVTTTKSFTVRVTEAVTMFVERPQSTTTSIYAFDLFEIDPEIDVTWRVEGSGELVAYVTNKGGRTKFNVLIVAMCREGIYINVDREVIYELEPNVTMKIPIMYVGVLTPGEKCVVFAAR